jgi:phosphatidylserine synthase
VVLPRFSPVLNASSPSPESAAAQHTPSKRVKWSVSYFGVKDLFTIINLMGGVAGIVLAFHGQIAWAGYSIFAGYLFGDVLDGPVARWTNTANRFGSEFDAASDHVGQAFAPAVIAYVAFRDGGHEALGVAVLASYLLTATIRQARFAVTPFNYPLTYCGLPRTVSGLIMVSMPNSLLFFGESPLGYNGAAAFLIVVAALNLSPIPYMTHKGSRLPGYLKALVAMFLLGPVVMVAMAPQFAYDLLFVITFGYAMGAWAPLTSDERREYWVEYKRWSHEVASLK